jgi:hypothetical protein
MSSASPRNVSEQLLKTIGLPSFCLLGFLAASSRAEAAEIDFDTYAAVAFSPSTGAYGYGWNLATRGQAERTALSKCTGDDARIVGWVQGGWLVLAIGDNKTYGVGWEYGDGADRAVAARRAIDECHSRKGKVQTIIHLCSGDIDPVVYK